MQVEGQKLEQVVGVLRGRVLLFAIEFFHVLLEDVREVTVDTTKFAI